MESFVESLEAPKEWCSSRWTGVEQCTDWVGYLMSTHGIYQEVFRMAFTDMRKTKAQQRNDKTAVLESLADGAGAPPMLQDALEDDAQGEASSESE